MHLLNHFSYHIRQLDNLLRASSELPQRAIMHLKQGYQQSNRHEAAFQILQMINWKEVFQYRELNANPSKPHCNDKIPLTKSLIKPMMNNPRPEIKTIDDLAKWCAMFKGELQNHIACCLKRFANFTDFIDNDQYFSHLNNAKYIQYNTVAIPMMSYQYDAQAVHIVHFTQSTWWGKHKPPSVTRLVLQVYFWDYTGSLDKL